MLQTPFYVLMLSKSNAAGLLRLSAQLRALCAVVIEATLLTHAAVVTICTLAGKSTLLKSMAGRLKDSGLKLGGEITFNGFTLDSFIPERTAAYVSQNDNHMAGKSQQSEGCALSGVCVLRKQRGAEGLTWLQECFVCMPSMPGSRLLHSLCSDLLCALNG